MTARRVLVIGGSGFIGTRLVSRLLARGDDVVIADKAPSAAHPDLRVACDVRDLDALRRVVPGHDVVVNLAAEHKDDVQPRSLYDEVNVEGARLVCRAAAEAGVDRLVFTSSVAVYGFADGELDEESPRRPFNDYGRTKLEAEQIYDAWFAEASGRTLVTVRPTVVFGEGNRGNVYNLLRQIASGVFVMIGPGVNRKSMAYVENVAACIEWSLDRPRGRQVFNYADKPDYTMNALVADVRRALGKSTRPPLRLPVAAGLTVGRLFDVVARATGRRFPISAIRVKKFTESTCIASERVRRMGFVAPVSLGDGLARMLQAEFSVHDSTPGERS